MVNDFTWKRVSDKEKEEILKESKRIMDSFSSKLGKLGLDKIKEGIIERNSGERVENGGDKLDIDKDIMFENAPHKNDDFIIAEKGGWK